MDFTNMKAKKVMVLTDKTIAKLRPMKVAIEALEREGIKYEVYDKVRVEPKDYSVQDAIEFGKKNPVDAFLAVGGGSVMDTAKIVNLYTTFPDANFLDFVCLMSPCLQRFFLTKSPGQRSPRKGSANYQASETLDMRSHYCWDR
jgi:alcohol dehydrogenase class IV